MKAARWSVGLICTMALWSACFSRGTRKAVVGFDSGLSPDRPLFMSHIEKLGITTTSTVLRNNPRSLYRAAIWILAVPSSPKQTLTMDDRTASALARYVRSGGKLLCVGSAQGWSEGTFPLNELGAKLGFKVLPVGTRRPRNLAPELLGPVDAVNRSFWSASEIQWSGEGKVLLADEDLRPMVVSLHVGKGQVVVVGHGSLLDENPELTQRLLLWLAGGAEE